MGDRRSARAALQLIVTGAPLSEEDAERALSYLAERAGRSSGFEVDGADAWIGCKEDVLTMDAAPVDPAALFGTALMTALRDLDPLVRLRAAERLGEHEHLGAAALTALARAVCDDPEEAVRAAALMALDRLDAGVSLPRRIVEAWAADPEGAAPYLAEALERLAARGAAATGVAALTGPCGDADGGLLLAGEGGETARVVIERDRVWMTMRGLPARFDNSKPWIAFPAALESQFAAVSWAGGEPGLVTVGEPVRDGAVRVLIGTVGEAADVEPSSGASSALRAENYVRLFDRVYLLENSRRK